MRMRTGARPVHSASTATSRHAPNIASAASITSRASDSKRRGMPNTAKVADSVALIGCCGGGR
jgi:hypothetical protein